jgi:hypothetical protein
VVVVVGREQPGAVDADPIFANPSGILVNVPDPAILSTRYIAPVLLNI